jgi:hypothetical protein
MMSEFNWRSPSSALSPVIRASLLAIGWAHYETSSTFWREIYALQRRAVGCDRRKVIAAAFATSPCRGSGLALG